MASISRARSICARSAVSVSYPVSVADVLDALLSATPNRLVGVLIDTVAKPLVEKERIEQMDLSKRSVVPGLNPARA